MRLVLADGGLEAPSLHLALGVAAGEGLVDALRWGASVRRVARRPEGDSFFAITAGTPVVDGAAVLEDPRWPAFCKGFREAGVTLALLTPARDPCLGAILEQAGAVIVLAAPGESVPLALRVGKSPVLAVLGREPPPPVEREQEAPSPAPTTPEPEPASGMEGLPPGPPDITLSREVPFWEVAEPEAEPAEPITPAPAAEPERDAPITPEPVAEPEPEVPITLEHLAEPEPEAPLPFEQVPEPAPETPLPPWPVPEAEPAPSPPSPSHVAEVLPEPELYGEPVPTFEEIVEESEAAEATPRWARRRTLFGLGFLLLVVAGAVAAALLGYLEIPGLSPRDATPAGTAAATPRAGTVSAPAATETSDSAPFSVALAAFQEEAAALTMVRDLSAKVPGVLFTAVPLSVDGQVLHRVLAGPAADSLAASALGARVAEAAGLAGDAWVPRWTPRAFQLGEMADQGAALRRSEVLQGLGVPSYVLAVTYSDGSVRFRVYAGAYADESEAAYLSGLLQERGLSGATLSERTGRLPE
jgi:hypothetical protein